MSHRQEDKELTAKLREMEGRGLRRYQMARELGVSKAAVTQKFRRMKEAEPDWFLEEMKQ